MGKLFCKRLPLFLESLLTNNSLKGNKFGGYKILLGKTQKILKMKPYGQNIFSEFLHFWVLAELRAPYLVHAIFLTN